ncbi:vitamin H transporter 1 [Colletotrichum spaethianum]|uniref:Vitamin H transporter 1 n=1 Tax=Colletotrichum spaethianum TaxID=700344 RepID=A0AA37LA57_9PEZI|nr:vitamin H transporter 1 [Colletotrichum spaethianum]GKT44638.1 vitamin H transporter 1 [Colletotrichum spaethianum]
MGEAASVSSSTPQAVIVREEPINYGPPEEGIFKHVAKIIPYFRDPRNVLVFKLDVMLLAWMFLAGIMKEMDQSATTQAYVSGMRESLNLYGNELVEFNTFFSIGYALGLVPAPNAQTIFGLRFFLGLFSSAFWPSVVALIFNWYTPAELAVRVACFTVCDVAGAMFLGALQAALFRDMNGVHGYAGWQWLFIIAGTVTVGQGLIAFVTVPDSPSNTRAIYLTENEKRLARERMGNSGVNTSKRISASVLRKKLRKLIVHPVTYFFLFSFAFSAWAHRANSYFVLYLESIKDSAGNRVYDTYHVNILPLGGYALQIVTNVGLNWLSDWKQWRWQISIFSAAAHGICLAVLCGWPSDHKVILAFYFLTYATNAGSPSLMAWMAEILRKEPEARSIIVAMTVTTVYVGHATIPLGAFRVADAPRYPIGFPLTTSFTVATILVQFGMLWWHRRHPEMAEYGYEPAINVHESSDEENPKLANTETAGSGPDPKTTQLTGTREL